ncbi:hypothetical protein FFLO_06312 [Filobasidium floriforme]|uniref:Uncharacterized protein n=1 Tax=Filobasidium floriforme TaxID=5210 RepID=A0A8K0NQK6_9TREE|nr:hypothetical protein FFLO_06312 [Filobasidium floriforme]
MRASTLVLVLSALAASVTSAHPITGSNDGGDAYSGAAGPARGGDIDYTEGKPMGNDNGLFFNYKGGKTVVTGNGGMTSSGNAQGAEGGLQWKRQQDKIEVGLDYTNGLLGDVLRRDVDHEKRLLDGGSEIHRQGNTYNSNGQNNGGLLGGILTRAEHEDEAHVKRLLDGGSEISYVDCTRNGMGGNGMQKRLLDGGSEITRCSNQGLLGNILSRDTHDNDKRLLDGGSELSSTGNPGLLSSILGRDVEEKRLLDFSIPQRQPEYDERPPQGPRKRLLDFAIPQRRPERPEYEQPEAAEVPEKRLLDFAIPQRRPEGPEKRLLDFSIPQRQPEYNQQGHQKRLLDFGSYGGLESTNGDGGLLGLKRSADDAMDKRLVGLGADLDDTIPLGDLGLKKRLSGLGQLLGSKGQEGTFGTGTGRTNLTTGNGGKSSTGNATGGPGGIGGGNGGDAYSGASGDASAGSIRLNRRQESGEADAEAEEPMELTPMDKGIGAAGIAANSPFGKAAHLDKLAGAAAPALPLFQKN